MKINAIFRGDFESLSAETQKALPVSHFPHSYKWSLKILFHPLFFKNICLASLFIISVMI